MSLCVTHVGSALLISAAHGPSQDQARLAQSLPRDPDRQLVIPDGPSTPRDHEWWHAAADLLRGEGPLRLVVSHAGSGLSVSPAQWLAERLGVEVTAPSGLLVPAGEGSSLFVVPGTGSEGEDSRWISFEPGSPPTAQGARFPAPLWEPHVPHGTWRTGSLGVVAPVPAGLWVHAGTDEPWHERSAAGPVLALQGLPRVLTVVIGAPDEPALASQDFAELCRMAPWLADSTSVRLISYGGSSESGQAVGQMLADHGAQPTATVIGLPAPEVGPPARAVLRDGSGRPTWRPFAAEVTYHPRQVETHRAPDPVVTSLWTPFPELRAVGSRPGVFEAETQVLVEVVQSGLWFRDTSRTVDTSVRAIPHDPERMRVTVGVPGEAVPEYLTATARTLADRLEPADRRFVEFVVRPGTAAPPPITSLLDDPQSDSPAPPPEPAATVDDRGLLPRRIRGASGIVRTGQTPSAAPQAGFAPAASGLGELPGSDCIPADQDSAGPLAASGLPPRFIRNARPTGTDVGSDSPGTDPRAGRPIAVLDQLPAAVPAQQAASTRLRAERTTAADAGPSGATGETRIGPAPPSSPATEEHLPAPSAATDPVEPRPGPPLSFAALPSVLDPHRHSTAQEHAWLRGHLAVRYDLYSSAVARLIAVRPGMRAPGGDQASVANLVAVMGYLDGGRAELERAAANGRIETLLPYLHCLVAGLGQLPSFRGVTYCGGEVSASAEPLVHGATVTDYGFRHAVTTAEGALPGSVEFVIWSTTARRLETMGHGRMDGHVIFVPGSRFRVLDPGDPADPVRRIHLREAHRGSDDGPLDQSDRAVLDRLSKAAAERDSAGEPASDTAVDETLAWDLAG